MDTAWVPTDSELSGEAPGRMEDQQSAVVPDAAREEWCLQASKMKTISRVIHFSLNEGAWLRREGQT